MEPDRISKVSPRIIWITWGFHFGTVDQANRRAKKSKNGINLIPVYLRITNPLRSTDAGDWGNPWQAWDTLFKATKGAIGEDLYAKMIDSEHISKPERIAMLMDKLKSLGYDGIVYKNRIEGKGDSYIVLSPTQIKSIYNSGSFEPTNPNISEGID